MEELTPQDFYAIIDASIQERGLVNHHLDSMNVFYESGLENIITKVFTIERTINFDSKSTDTGTEIDNLFLKIDFSRVYISPPTVVNPESNKEEPLFPLEATRRELTYKGSVYLDATISVTAYYKNGKTEERKDSVKNQYLSKLPIMVKSKCCNLYNLPKASLLNLGEDPNDPGGYFIVKGQEKTIDITENIAYNQLRIFLNNYEAEYMRGEMISHPGEFTNSDQFILRWSKTSEITVEIRRDQLAKIKIPFYVIFRLLGWPNDKMIYDYILNEDYESDTSKIIQNILQDAFEGEYKDMKGFAFERDRYLLIEDLARKVYNRNPMHFDYLKIHEKPENIMKIHEYVEQKIDNNFLPHLGIEREHRHDKAVYVAKCIRNMILNRMNVISSTDRDSYANKRLLPAGSSFGKFFKFLFNVAIARAIRSKVSEELKNTPFAQANLATMFKNAIHTVDFEKLMVQILNVAKGSAIKTSSKKSSHTNKIQSQQLQRKNPLTTIALTRTISESGNASSSTKQSERAMEMREQHSSHIGYVCLGQSPVGGEKVGLNKQCAITMSLTRNYSGLDMRNMLLQDSDMIPYTKIRPRDLNDLHEVYVNGFPIGACKNPVKFRAKYVKMRRERKFAKEISVQYNHEFLDVRFYTDSDRPTRPLIIVYNSERDPEFFGKGTKNWEQKILLTKKHIAGIMAGDITMADLVDEQIIEYIDSSEQENVYVCPRYEVLLEEKNNPLNEYTHVDIPQALFGLVALSSPFANHNEVTRLFYQASQAQQTMGSLTYNWPLRSTDKDVSVQYYLEDPLVKTLQNKYVQPNGCNAIVAIMCYTGYNVEDSQIFSKGSVERGIFNGCKLTNYRTTFEGKEELEIPDPTKCKLKTNYHNLVKGNNLPRINSVVHENDPLIPKMAKIGSKERDADSKDSIDRIDKSILYKEHDGGIIHDAYVYKQEGDTTAAKVVIRKPRPVSLGDKFSSRSGQKGVISAIMPQSYMPFTESGMMPDIIINPHSFPSRMTIGQICEGLIAKGCAVKGTQMDGTIFTKPDYKIIGEILTESGYEEHGYDYLYSGITGKRIDIKIYINPIYYQRLQKFASDQENTVSKGPTDALSFQPLDGKAANGGIRFGEMERDILSAQGVTKTMYEKLFLHSDAYTDCICKCGKPGIINTFLNIYYCKHCGDNASLYQIDSAWSPKAVLQEAESAGFGIRRIPEPNRYPAPVSGFENIDVYN